MYLLNRVALLGTKHFLLPIIVPIVPPSSVWLVPNYKIRFPPLLNYLTDRWRKGGIGGTIAGETGGNEAKARQEARPRVEVTKGEGEGNKARRDQEARLRSRSQAATYDGRARLDGREARAKVRAKIQLTVMLVKDGEARRNAYKRDRIVSGTGFSRSEELQHYSKTWGKRTSVETYNGSSLLQGLVFYA